MSCKKSSRRSIYWALVLLFASSSASSFAERVSVEVDAVGAISRDVLFSVKPLAILYIELTGLSVKPEQVLMTSGRNLHDYHLSLSDIKRVQAASVIFWMGEKNEGVLVSLAKKQDAGVQNKWHAMAGSEHEWLGLKGQLALIARFSLELQNLQPELKAEIITNEDKLIKSLQQKFSVWRSKAKNLRQLPVLMAHTAFEVFVSDLSLPAPEFYSTGHSHGKAAQGGRHGLHVQQEIKHGDIVCAIEEPDASFHQLKNKFPQLSLIMLEPMADSQALEQGSWLIFWQHNWRELSRCVGVK